MRTRRKLVKITRKSWATMVPANTVALLHVPVRRTVWELKIGNTTTLTLVRQARPVTPEAFREDKPLTNAAPDLWKTIAPNYGDQR